MSEVKRYPISLPVWVGIPRADMVLASDYDALAQQLGASQAHADEGWAVSAERGMRNARLEAELAARDKRLAEAVGLLRKCGGNHGAIWSRSAAVKAFLSGEDK